MQVLPLFSPRMDKKPSFQRSPLFGAEIPHDKITLGPNGKHTIPNRVRIPFIEGDGIGPEIMREAQRVVDKAVALAYPDYRSIEWVPLEAGEKALAKGQGLLPPETLESIRDHKFFVKGPLNTPTGGGFRSINVALRKLLDLFACVRPIKNIPGVVTPMKQDRTDVVLFRENTEDTYSGIEFAEGDPRTQRLIRLLKDEFDVELAEDSALCIKNISKSASKRLVREAIRFALEDGRQSVTLVHKGNIMKLTEGAFAQWGKELAREEFGDRVLLWDDFQREYNADFSRLPKGKLVIQERLTDAKFQDVVLNPQWDSVVATMNLNGDYLSDAYAATVGGLGVAPGANIGQEFAMFESVHGSAPDIAGQNKANPTALMLTMTMLLDQMGWKDASTLLMQSIEETLKARKMTGDLARAIPNTPALSTQAFTDAVIQTMETLGQPRTLSFA